MKILWFSITPSLYNAFSNGHNGGGWIASLEQIVRQAPEVELGIAFHFASDKFKNEQQGVTYYPMPQVEESKIDKLFHPDAIDARKLDLYRKVVDDFRPDIVQIFGSENDFGLLCGSIGVPIVIHMQGCIPPCYNAVFPIDMNIYDFFFTSGLTMRNRYIGLRTKAAFKRNAEREIRAIQSCQYFMGRTAWDRSLIDLFNPSSQYFHCNEALRDSFLRGDKQWSYSASPHKTIVSVISTPWYKGLDLILKTAQLLKRFTSLDFEWQVYGVRDIRFFENKYKIKAADVNVKIMGPVGKDVLVDALCSASCYVHSSYIDNSPNSLCEAQIIGVPVIATHVGGISTLVDDRHTGLLFPANAPYDLASMIKQIVHDEQLSTTLSLAERQEALRRHNPDAIRSTLIDIYRSIIAQQK